MKKNLASATLLTEIIILVVAILFNSCGGRNTEKSDTSRQQDFQTAYSTTSDSTDISEEIKNFRLHQSRGAKVAWTLIASKARFISNDEVSLEKPILKLYPQNPSESSGADSTSAFSPSGQPTVITAEKGKAELKTSSILTYGSTLLESPDKRIYASDVIYEPSSDRIFTDKKVLIITADSEITGSSMVSDSRLEKITISDQQVRMKPK